MMGVVGLMIATIGIDPQVGNTRFMFGQLWLMDGIDFLVLAVALFGVGEVLASVEQGLAPPKVELTIRNLLPDARRLDRAAAGRSLRGTVIGFLIGVLPGAGATIASFIAYAVEKKISKHPEQFGNGAIEGVAAPEAANNAAATGAMVPMFALGIPGSGTTAVMLGALIMFGLRPGPQLFEKNADLVWGVIASMYVGNVMLLVLNLPLAGMFATLLRVRYTLLYPVILALCIAGVYSQANSADDLWVMSVFGVLGYLDEEVRLPGRAAGAGPGARADAGDRAAPVDDAVARQPRHLRHAPDLRGADRRHAAGRAGAAVRAPVPPPDRDPMTRPRRNRRMDIRARIGIDCGRQLAIEDAVAWAARHGISYLEVEADHAPNALESFTDERCRPLRAACERHGITSRPAHALRGQHRRDLALRP